MTKGLKYDNGKSPVVKGALQYFPEALMEVARVSEFGATKYAWDDWRHVPNAEDRYIDALGRHLLLDGMEDIDPESKFDHLAHVAWNALATLELRIKQEKDKEKEWTDTQSTSTSQGMQGTFQQQHGEKAGAKLSYDTWASSETEEQSTERKHENW